MFKKIVNVQTTGKLFSHLRQFIRNATSFTMIKQPILENYTEIIDVRIPKKFELGHIPGATNLPALQDDELDKMNMLRKTSTSGWRKQRSQTIYNNVSNHMAMFIEEKEIDSYKPLIYCTNGGISSQKMAMALSRLGCEVDVLEGGYKAYSKQIYGQVEGLARKFQFRTVAGLKGCGKSLVLSKLAEAGEQVLDLAEMAHNKRAVLGYQLKKACITQIDFELQIIKRFQDLNTNRVVWVEFGPQVNRDVYIPLAFHEAICTSDRYVLNMPLTERVRHIIRDNQYFIDNFAYLMKKKKKKFDAENLANWIALGEESKWEELIKSICVDYHDPSYMKDITKYHSNNTVQISLDNLSEESVNKCLQQILE